MYAGSVGGIYVRYEENVLTALKQLEVKFKVKKKSQFKSLNKFFFPPEICSCFCTS